MQIYKRIYGGIKLTFLLFSRKSQKNDKFEGKLREATYYDRICKGDQVNRRNK